MNLKKHILVCLFVLGFTATLSAQYNPSEIFLYKGRVVTEENKPVPFAHIITMHNRHATITDTTGYFRVSVFSGDSLRISSIGFHTKTIVFNQNEAGNEFHIIKLEKKAYDLPIVNINEIRWQLFKSEFMEKEVEENKAEESISLWMADLVPLDEIRMIKQNAKRRDWLYLDRYKR